MRKIKYIVVCILLFIFMCTGCKKNIVITTGFNEGEIVKISGKAVSSSEVMILLLGEKESFDKGLDNQFWEIKYKDKTMTEYFKENVKESFIKLNVLSEFAKSKNVTLSENEKNIVNEACEKYIESADAAILKKYNISESNVKTLIEKIILSNKVTNKVLNDYVIEISDEEARVIYINCITINSNEEKALDVAKEIYDRVILGSDMKSIAQKYDYATYSEKYVSRVDFSSENSDSVFKLKDGEVLPVFEENGVLYIVKCINDYDEVMTIANKQVLVEKKKQEEFDKEYRPYEKDVNVEFNTTLWNEINMPTDKEIAGANIYDILEEAEQ